MTNEMGLYRDFMRVSHALRHGHGEPELRVAPGQQRVLTTLAKDGAMSQRALIAAMGIAPASMSELLAKLEQKKLIKRGRSEQDRRVVLVSLTKEGEQQAESLLAAERKIATEVFGVLSKSDREELARLLTLMINSHS